MLPSKIDGGEYSVGVRPAEAAVILGRFQVFMYNDAVGRTPRVGCFWCSCGVEYTARWVGTSRVQGTELQTLGGLEVVCNEAVPPT